MPSDQNLLRRAAWRLSEGPGYQRGHARRTCVERGRALRRESTISLWYDAMTMGQKSSRRQARSRSWDPVADWYAGWAGPTGSRHHRELAIPALLKLLGVEEHQRILDLGCGAGALAEPVLAANAQYVGVDLSRRLLAVARRHHGARAQFVWGDVTRLPAIPSLRGGSFDAATFLLSLQDINPLEDAVASAAWALKRNGCLVILLTHPCFRVPRQSGWGWDEKRQLRYRRIDRYLTPIDVPMQEYGGQRPGTTRSYHRPLQRYFAVLGQCGFAVDALEETAASLPVSTRHNETRAERIAREEIPLFLGLRARQCMPARASGSHSHANPSPQA